MQHAPLPPPNATDCHTHLVGDLASYPMASPRSYTPQPATPQDMRRMLQHTGIERVVIVQISVYGVDNTCMLDGMRTLKGDLAGGVRGVVQVDDATPDSALDEMHKAGICGIRVNLSTAGVRDPAEARRQLQRTAAKCARNGWHLQVFTGPDVIAEIGDALQALPVPVVLDHFGLLPMRDRGGPAERVVLDLLSQGSGWVKISGTYRLENPSATADIAALARDLYRTNPERIVWGSDWPHSPAHASAPTDNPPSRPYREIDPADMLATIPAWFDAPEDRARILVTNPATLYEFPD
ncbi:MAG: amidohydrolase family protein [Pseudomonadota bacterium]